MPRITNRTNRKRSNGRGAVAAYEDGESQANAGERAEVLPPPAPELSQEELAKLAFFDYLRRAYSPTDWGEHIIVYLYRLAPQIQNPHGTPSYIDRYVQPFDEALVKEQHGGGKYRAMLKDLRVGESVRTHEFVIDGDPKYRPGQTILSGNGTPAGQVIPSGTPTPPAQPEAVKISDLAQVIREVAQMAKQNPQRSDEEIINAAIGTLRKGMEGALEIVTSTAKAQANSSTGNPVTDRLLQKMMDRFDAPAEKPRSLSEQLTDLLPLIKLLRPESGDGELSLLKDVLGPDGLKDLLLDRGRGRGDDRQSQLFSFGAKLLEQAPGLMDRFAAMQAASFERALSVAEFRRGAQPVAPNSGSQISTIPLGTTAPPATVSAGTAQMASTAGVSEDAMLNAILGVVVNSFDAGDNGEMAAITVKRAFPQVVPMFAGMLADLTQVQAWALTQPTLGAIAKLPEFPQFLQEFAVEILRDENAPEEQTTQNASTGQ